MTLKNIAQKNEWMIFNVQETGYYRVNYQDDNWRLLRNALVTNHQVIQGINRAQILDDSLNLARAGMSCSSNITTSSKFMKLSSETVFFLN